MEISVDKKLKTLQEEFNASYPFLRIEFYSGVYNLGQASSEKSILNNELTVGEINPTCPSGFMPMNSYQKVGEFEQTFFKMFGLNVQVFRKSQDRWLQTWATDVWTLEEQNERGRIMGEYRA